MRELIRDKLIGLTRKAIQLQSQSSFSLLEFKANATGEPNNGNSAA